MDLNFRSNPCGKSVVFPVLFSLALVSNAHAHVMVEGAGDIGNGALHPWLTASHILILVALALLLGQREPFDLKIPIRVFTPLSAIALAVAGICKIEGVYQPMMIAVALCLAVLVGLAVKLPRIALALLCAAAAIGIGLDSGVENSSAFTIAKVLIGTWFSVNMAVIYLAICASNCAGKPWAKVGIRIIGSWIIAISLMILAFFLRR